MNLCERAVVKFKFFILSTVFMPFAANAALFTASGVDSSATVDQSYTTNQGEVIGSASNSGTLNVNDSLTFSNQTRQIFTLSTNATLNIGDNVALIGTGLSTAALGSAIWASRAKIYAGDGVSINGFSSSNGGALYAENGTYVEFGDGAIFRNNITPRGSAALEIGSSSTVVFGNGALFEGNKSTGTAQGGGVSEIYGNASMIFGDNTTFRNNSSAATLTNRGGGVFEVNPGSITFGNNTLFEKNSSSNGGGAILLAAAGSSATFDGATTFDGNTATKNGGAIYSVGTLNFDTTQGDVVFKNNKSANGVGNDIYSTGTIKLVGDDNEMVLNGGLAGTGTFSKTGANELKVNGDSSDYTGTFTQIAGKTVVSETGKMFKGTNNVSTSELEVTAAGIDYKVNLGDEGILNHYNTTSTASTIDDTAFVFTGVDAIAHFGKAGTATEKANYLLTGNLENGESNSVKFSGSNVKISNGVEDFTGETAYFFEDAMLSLEDELAERNAEFTSLSLDKSTVDLRNSTLSRNTRGYNTLTVNKFNSANNSVLRMNVNLDKNNLDGDLLVIKGADAELNGSTLLRIVDNSNGGAMVDGDGLMVVNVMDTTSSAKSFALYGGQVDSGAYIYKLYKGDENGSGEDWYLRTGRKTPTDVANSVTQEPIMMMGLAKTASDDLVKRMGELRNASPCNNDGLWVRTYGRHIEMDDNVEATMNVYGIDAGYDKMFIYDKDNLMFAGVMAGYTYTDNMKTTQKNGYSGSGDGSAPSIGAYLTWFNKKGWFMDFFVRNFWTDFDVVSYTSQGDAIKYKTNRNLLMTSAEFGKRSVFKKHRDSYYYFEPKAQVTYSFANDNKYMASNGKSVVFDDTHSVVGSVAAVLGYNTRNGFGEVMEAYIKFAILNEFFGETIVMFDGARFKSDMGGVSFEGALGLNSRINKNWSMYSEFIYEYGEIIESYGVNLGVRYAW